MQFDEFVLAASLTDLSDEPDARNHAGCVEFRMDLAVDPCEQLRSYKGELPVIVTNRPRWEGGNADEEGRIETMAMAVEYECVKAVDVELRTVREGNADRLLDTVREDGIAVIVSSHNFEQTPDEADMRRILIDACKHGDVGKLAVTATNMRDVLSLLSVTYSVSTMDYRVATMSMGATGRHSRAVAPLYGSKIGYAPVIQFNTTAPGQYDLETLAALVETLR